jgi:hypothetical protein
MVVEFADAGDCEEIPASDTSFVLGRSVVQGRRLEIRHELASRNVATYCGIILSQYPHVAHLKFMRLLLSWRWYPLSGERYCNTRRQPDSTIRQLLTDALKKSTDPSANWGAKTACTVFRVEPSPMAANAMRFCFRTVRT